MIQLEYNIYYQILNFSEFVKYLILHNIHLFYLLKYYLSLQQSLDNNTFFHKKNFYLNILK